MNIRGDVLIKTDNAGDTRFKKMREVRIFPFPTLKGRRGKVKT